MNDAPGPSVGPPGRDRARADAAAGEAVEVVDEAGTVLRSVPRAEMRAGRLRHRCTYVAVVDGAGRLFVHQRAAWKDVWPSRWDLAFGGVVGVGESWVDAARREQAEEAGLTTVPANRAQERSPGQPDLGSERLLGPVDLIEVAAGSYDDADVSVVGRAYVVSHDGPFTFPDGEVVAHERVPLDELDPWLAGHDLCPDSVHFLFSILRAGPPWASEPPG